MAQCRLWISAGVILSGSRDPAPYGSMESPWDTLPPSCHSPQLINKSLKTSRKSRHPWLSSDRRGRTVPTMQSGRSGHFSSTPD